MAAAVLALHNSSASTYSPVQAASDVNSPVSGEVTDVNSSLTDESSKVWLQPHLLVSAPLHAA